jgi:hypothetical protein
MVNLAFCNSIVTAALLLVMSGGVVTDSRIQLIHGKRSIKDKVSFIVEVAHEANENARNAKAPEFAEVSAEFAGPASGVIVIDGKGIARFDECSNLTSQRTEITYGRHVVTLQVSSPAVATSLMVFVRGAVLHEIIGDEIKGSGSGASNAISLEDRLSELDRRVKQLEVEVAALKRR